MYNTSYYKIAQNLLFFNKNRKSNTGYPICLKKLNPVVKKDSHIQEIMDMRIFVGACSMQLADNYVSRR